MNLYVSDLDGTLLNSDQLITPNSTKIINDLIENGLNFTVATARTPATVVKLLENLNINMPIVTMNGATIYDIKNDNYIVANSITEKQTKQIVDILNKHNRNSFIYTLKNNHLYVYHQDFQNEEEKNFYEERKESKFKTFLKEDVPLGANVLYFTIMDTKENIDIIYNAVKSISGLYLVAYKDIYSHSTYNLEIYSEKASKANAIKHIKEKFNFEKVITFGDNLNDLPMFKISDECYAVKNALEELKELATNTIECNNSDGVANFILSHYKNL
ncbi:MAG: HAD family hydrolase [Clostridium sp.]